MAWLGRKKLALIPLSRTNAQPPDVIPAGWADLIMGRIFFQKDPKTSTDRSVRAWVHTVSSGLADLDVVVMPPQTIDGQDIAPDALEKAMGNQLRAQGFDGAAIVMLGGPYGGETIGYWSRFCMSDDLGHWVGELVHQTGLCSIPDFFDFEKQYPDQPPYSFEQEAGYCAVHFLAWTKRAVGWLVPSAVGLHSGQAATYTLHASGLIQPPPAGRITALQIGQQVPYLMVEARLKTDQFEINLPSEGVIVYLVQTSDPLGNAQNSMPPLNLLTKTALIAGQSFTAGNGFVIQVVAALPGGFTLSVTEPSTDVPVPDVFEYGVAEATKAVQGAGLVPVFTGPKPVTGPTHSAPWVAKQSPVSGALAPKGSKVTMTLSILARP